MSENYNCLLSTLRGSRQEKSFNIPLRGRDFEPHDPVRLRRRWTYPDLCSGIDERTLSEEQFAEEGNVQRRCGGRDNGDGPSNVHNV